MTIRFSEAMKREATSRTESPMSKLGHQLTEAWYEAKKPSLRPTTKKTLIDLAEYLLDKHIRNNPGQKSATANIPLHTVTEEDVISAIQTLRIYYVGSSRQEWRFEARYTNKTLTITLTRPF